MEKITNTKIPQPNANGRFIGLLDTLKKNRAKRKWNVEMQRARCV